MRKRPLIVKCLAVGIILLFVGIVYAPAMAQNMEKPISSSRGTWLYVGGSGSGNYSRIQDAINDSSEGDTIFVFHGIYYENVIVNKAINLIGENPGTTVIDGQGVDDVFHVISEAVKISGFTIQNSGHNGISVGWDISYVSNIIISNNNIINHQIGINFYYPTENNLITGNNISFTYGGIHLNNQCNNNTIINNHLAENQVYPTIDIYECSGNKIIENSIHNNDHGIRVHGSRDNSILKNNLSFNFQGLMLEYSSSNIVSNNSINSNGDYGIYIRLASDNNTINNNNIISNNRGIYLTAFSDLNLIFHNNFINNPTNAFDDGNNTWNNDYPSCGNYWDSYVGDDTFWGQNQEINGSDGVGDTPYNISGGSNQDHYPLMLPYDMTTLTITIQPVLFHLSIIIKNVGTTTAFNVQWNSTIDGFVLFGKETSGFLPKNLLPGEEARVALNKLFIGLGRIEVTAIAWADNAPVVTDKVNGHLLLFFFIIIGG